MHFDPDTWIIDGHNDVLSVINRSADPMATCEKFVTGLPGNIDLPKLRSGGMGGGFFAIWISDDRPKGETSIDPLNTPQNGMVPQATALRVAKQELAIFERLCELEAITLCTDTTEIRAANKKGDVAAILHMEGVEALDMDLELLDFFFERGLRSLGPVWSRNNAFGNGVPFRFPSSPDIGDGLTEAGFHLVKRCNELRILVDLSHLNEAGFWDVAKTSDAPLVATHSNVHAICQQSRNLTDKQLDAIADTGGLVGLNFGVGFLRKDGMRIADTSPDVMLEHLDYMIEKLGEEGVALGSDFDGTMMPEFIKDASGLPALVSAMENHGYGKELVRKICHENWLGVLKRTWGS